MSRTSNAQPASARHADAASQIISGLVTSRPASCRPTSFSANRLSLQGHGGAGTSGAARHVEEGDILGDAVAACEPHVSPRHAERLGQLLPLRLDPGPPGPAGLVLVEGEHVAGLQAVPDGAGLRRQDVIEAGFPSGFKPGVRIQEDDAALLGERRQQSQRRL